MQKERIFCYVNSIIISNVLHNNHDCNNSKFTSIMNCYNLLFVIIIIVLILFGYFVVTRKGIILILVDVTQNIYVTY